MYTLLAVACSLATLECSMSTKEHIATYKECILIGKLFNEIYSVSNVHQSAFKCDDET